MATNSDAFRKLQYELNQRPNRATWRPTEMAHSSATEGEMIETDILVNDFADATSGGMSRTVINKTNRKFWQKAKDTTSDVMYKAKEVAENVSENATQAVKQYPLQALVVGLLAGAAAGFVITRRS